MFLQSFHNKLKDKILHRIIIAYPTIGLGFFATVGEVYVSAGLQENENSLVLQAMSIQFPDSKPYPHQTMLARTIPVWLPLLLGTD
jgi:hypothetical protein